MADEMFAVEVAHEVVPGTVVEDDPIQTEQQLHVADAEDTQPGLGQTQRKLDAAALGPIQLIERRRQPLRAVTPARGNPPAFACVLGYDTSVPSLYGSRGRKPDHATALTLPLPTAGPTSHHSSFPPRPKRSSPSG